MFERKGQRLAPLGVFIRRMVSSFGIALGMIAMALSIGMSGYHWIAGFNWIDSLLEASMILAGMGPVNPLATNAAKVFASLYALFSGLVFIGIMGVILTPAVHRLIHKFHLESNGSDSVSAPKHERKSK